MPAEVRALRHKQLELSASHFHTVAFDRVAGKLFAWGYPDSGLLGLGADIKDGDGTGHRWMMETAPRELHIFDDPTAQNPTAQPDEDDEDDEAAQ